jgi:hypothetical protein
MFSRQQQFGAAQRFGQSGFLEKPPTFYISPAPQAAHQFSPVRSQVIYLSLRQIY